MHISQIIHDSYLKEVCMSFLKFSFPQVHFSSALPAKFSFSVVVSYYKSPDHSQDKGVGNGRLDVKALVVQSLKFLVILLGCVHLDLEGIHLKTREQSDQEIF